VIKALNELEVITLFVEDLASARTFYTDVFGLEVAYRDDESAVVKLKNVLINLLVAREAHDLIAPTPVASAGTGARRCGASTSTMRTRSSLNSKRTA
jgi:catechol 2,3-dioxygenase-like lactoylglutathione lyase family enzyme